MWAIGPSAEWWLVSGSHHVGGITAQLKAYEQRVTGFLDRALLSTSR